jgi:hypothetical protein
MTHQQIGVHRDIAELITSREAQEETPQMARIYYRLLLAPAQWWVGSETLRVRVNAGEGATTTAWDELVDWLEGVSAEEAQKALGWLNEKQVISYQREQSGDEIEISFAGLYFSD